MKKKEIEKWKYLSDKVFSVFKETKKFCIKPMDTVGPILRKSILTLKKCPTKLIITIYVLV